METTEQSAIFSRFDSLGYIGEDAPLESKLVSMHNYVRQRFPQIERISVALYDAGADTLKTFLHSTQGDNPLPLYEAKLDNSPSLKEIIATRQPRVVNDTDALGQASFHAARIQARGFGSSYTMPIFHNGDFIGFIFFDAQKKGAFDDAALHYFDIFGHLLALMVIDGLAAIKALVAAVRSASNMALHRDFETGAHLDRMAHYSRLIAREIAPKYGLDDATVERIFLFAPLHDIGKIGIPDHILLKRGKLDPPEWEVMKTHPTIGSEIIESMLVQFRIKGHQQSSILHNIALHHHEGVDGSGYPGGLLGDDIPLEARIVAVADVFDALTSARSYKRAWSTDEAFRYLTEQAQTRFDHDCVAALIGQRAEIEQIQIQYAEKTGRG